MNLFPQQTVWKTLPFKFNGVELQFQVSHALFSSHQVDEGTQLLLKTLVQRQAIPNQGKVLDIGCGTGIIGVCIAKKYPETQVWARDRLALAASYTQQNSLKNKVNLKVKTALLADTEEQTFDLVISNVPAKAGAPVLEDFLYRTHSLLNPLGLLAIVIVAPLADWFEETALKKNWQIIFKEDKPGYRVLHLSQKEQEAAVSTSEDFPGSYRRADRLWKLKNHSYNLTTVWGLANFDNEDFRIQLAQKMLNKNPFSGTLLVWESGQGQTALLGGQRSSEGLPQLILTGTDLLSLKISQYNLDQNGQILKTAPLCVPSFGALAETLDPRSIDCGIFNIYTEPQIPWTDEYLTTINFLIKNGGVILLTGRSTDITRLLENHKGLRILQDQRLHGWRGVLMERTT